MSFRKNANSDGPYLAQEKSCIDMQQWLRSSLGQYVLAVEARLVNKILDQRHDNLVIFSNPDFVTNLQSKAGLQVFVSRFKKDNIDCSVTARIDKLPFATDSIDKVYLPHCLEAALNPHEVLRETYRILRPEGYAIISCFNPFSIWGLRRHINFWNKASPWSYKFFSAGKLHDWLNLLGFKVTRKTNYCYLPPLNHSALLAKLKSFDSMAEYLRLPFAACYIVVAYKKVIPLTLIRDKWQDELQDLALELPVAD